MPSIPLWAPWAMFALCTAFDFVHCRWFGGNLTRAVWAFIDVGMAAVTLTAIAIAGGIP